MRRKFDRLARTTDAAPRFLLYANLREVVTRAGRQAFEAYLTKMRFVTGQPCFLQAIANNCHSEEPGDEESASS